MAIFELIGHHWLDWGDQVNSKILGGILGQLKQIIGYDLVYRFDLLNIEITNATCTNIFSGKLHHADLEEIDVVFPMLTDIP